jgi:hypothetical protein
MIEKDESSASSHNSFKKSIETEKNYTYYNGDDDVFDDFKTNFNTIYDIDHENDNIDVDKDDEDDDVQLYDSFEHESKSALNLKSSFVITSEYDDDFNTFGIQKHNNDGKLPIQGTVRKNKMFKKLNVVEAQSFIENAAEKSHEFTASALKHQHTSYVCFENFLQSIGKTLSALESPIPNDLLLAWVHASLIDGTGKDDEFYPMYGVDSFREVYIPHLLRFFERNNYIYDTSVKKLMLNKVKEMIRLKQIAEKQMPVQRGANPLCVWDVSYIIQTTPIGIYIYHEIMTWLCLGLHTGQRAISLGNLKWKDIHVQHFGHDSSNSKFQIVITFVRGKNNFSWNHRQTLEGDILVKSDNPLFWLDQLYKEQVHQANVSLFDEGHLCLLPNEFIFQTPKQGETGFRDSTDVACMKDQINKVAVYCGYPANFFTNHSGRSGMQICYFILRKLQGKTDSDTWEDISLYLGYAPKAQNQIKYFQNNFKITLVLNRAFDANAPLSSIIAENMLNPLSFHQLKKDSFMPLWKLSDSFQSISELIRNFIKTHVTDRSLSTLEVHSVFTKLVTFVVKSEDSLIFKYMQQVALHCEVPAFKNKNMRDKYVFFHYIMKLAAKYWNSKRMPLWKLVESLLEKLSLSERIVNWIASYKPTGLKKTQNKKSSVSYEKRSLRAITKEQKKKANDNADILRISTLKDLKKQKEKALTLGKSKKRRFWTDEETLQLCEMYLEHGNNWSKFLIEGRSSVNVKDRMRTLQTTLGTNSFTNTAIQWISQYNEEKNDE